MSKTGILLIHFRNSPHTDSCLDSLSSLKTKEKIKIYILNVQGEEKPSFTNHSTKPIIINESHNYGFSGGNNLMMRQALADGCDRFILLNNDTVVADDFVDPLLHQMDESVVGMVCPKIYFYQGYEFHHDSYKESERGKVIWYMGGVLDWKNVYGSHWGVDEVDHGQFEESAETDFATGCCLGIRADVIQKVGMFDERYFLYYEDADWSMRTRLHGYKIIVEPKSVIWHKNAGSTSGPGSKLHMYYQTRNRFLFGMRYAPLRTKYHLLRQYVGYLQNGDETVHHATLDAFTGHYGDRKF